MGSLLPLIARQLTIRIPFCPGLLQYVPITRGRCAHLSLERENGTDRAWARGAGKRRPGDARVPRDMSNALLVSAAHSVTGRPLAVMGPQVAYFARRS